jgi:hypothetical protein
MQWRLQAFLLNFRVMPTVQWIVCNCSHVVVGYMGLNTI